MNSPAVSIVLPFHQASATIDESLDSMRTQTLTEFECLAINDRSSDATAAKIRALDDPRFRVLDNPGRGLVDALNCGLAQARAPLIARMDADDIMLPERLALQAQFLQQHADIDLVACRVRKFPVHLVTDGYREYIRWQNRCLTPEQIAMQIYRESPLAHPSVMFRRDVIRHWGDYRDGPFPEDYDLWLRLFRAGCRMAKLPQVLLEWRESGTRLSRNDSRYAREAFDRLRAEYLAGDSRLHSGRPVAIWGAGRKTRRRTDWLLRKGIRPIAWIDIDPRKIGNRIDNVPVVAPRWLTGGVRPFVLIYVASHGAREIIHADLQRVGFREGDDFLHVG